MAKQKTFKSAVQQEEFDEETGEIIRQTLLTEVVDGYVDLKLPQKHKLNNGGFITLFQSALITIAKNKKLFTKDEYAILFYLLGCAGLGNSINIDYYTLVDDLEIQRTNLVTAIKSLENKKIILRRKNGARRKDEVQEYIIKVNFDQLNYNLAYNGKIKDFAKLKFEHPQLEFNNKKQLANPNQKDIFDDIAERE